jgi:hypothetical protein
LVSILKKEPRLQPLLHQVKDILIPNKPSAAGFPSSDPAFPSFGRSAVDPSRTPDHHSSFVSFASYTQQPSPLGSTGTSIGVGGVHMNGRGMKGSSPRAFHLQQQQQQFQNNHHSSSSLPSPLYHSSHGGGSSNNWSGMSSLPSLTSTSSDSNYSQYSSAGISLSAASSTPGSPFYRGHPSMTNNSNNSSSSHWTNILPQAQLSSSSRSFSASELYPPNPPVPQVCLPKEQPQQQTQQLLFQKSYSTNTTMSSASSSSLPSHLQASNSLSFSNSSELSYFDYATSESMEILLPSLREEIEPLSFFKQQQQQMPLNPSPELETNPEKVN